MIEINNTGIDIALTMPAMLDLETLGTGANSAIISIGACRFDPDSSSVYDTFHGVISKESCFAIGMTADPDTIKWWDGQSAEAKAGSYEHPNPTDIYPVLLAFSDWMNKDSEIWGNGSDFDNAMLAEAYRKAGIPLPWKFWNNRCYRTMKNQFPDVAMSRHGTHHNALDDAISQAKHLCKIVQRMRNMRVALGTTAA